jgi:hypothetical protein
MSEQKPGDGAQKEPCKPSKNEMELVKIVCDDVSFTAHKYHLCMASLWMSRELDKTTAVPLTPEGASLVLHVPQAGEAHILQSIIVIS